MGAKPLWACAGCRDADAGGLCVADRDGGVGVVEDEFDADVVGVGVVAVGLSGNCCVSVGGGWPWVAPPAGEAIAAAASAITHDVTPTSRTGFLARLQLHCARSPEANGTPPGVLGGRDGAIYGRRHPRAEGPIALKPSLQGDAHNRTHRKNLNNSTPSRKQIRGKACNRCRCFTPG
jgi:hypothetical protein